MVQQLISISGWTEFSNIENDHGLSITYIEDPCQTSKIRCLWQQMDQEKGLVPVTKYHIVDKVINHQRALWNSKD